MKIILNPCHSLRLSSFITNKHCASLAFNLVQDDSNLKEDEMLIWLQGNYWQGDRSKYLLGDKYMFYFSYKNKTGLNIVNSAPVNKNG